MQLAGCPVSPAGLCCAARHPFNYWPRDRKRYWIHSSVVSPLFLLTNLTLLTMTVVPWPMSPSAVRLLRSLDISRFRSSRASRCLQGVYFWWLLVLCRTTSCVLLSEAFDGGESCRMLGLQALGAWYR